MRARLRYEVAGSADAPVVLLGPSLGTTSAIWAAQIPLLARQFRVVAFDHRGHGKSESPPGPWAIDDFGLDVVALLDELDVSRISYVGVSLGGMVGMWLTAHVPQRVERLVVICTSAHLHAQQYWADRAATVRKHGMQAIVDPVVERWFTPAFAARCGDVVQQHKQMLGSTPVQGYAAACEAIGAMDLRPDLPHISAPTAVIVGADDLAIPVENSHEIAAAVPGARLVVVRDAAHLANVEQPEQVSRAIVEHLEA
jgi:3-oxoadipate enol-lactonase